jgi:hypothetical protein
MEMLKEMSFGNGKVYKYKRRSESEFYSRWSLLKDDKEADSCNPSTRSN